MPNKTGILKKIRGRQLRGGGWVLVADGSSPVVVDASVANIVLHEEGGPLDPALIGTEAWAALDEAGFVANDGEPVRPLPGDSPSQAMRLVRVLTWISLLFFSPIILALSLRQGFPGGASLVLHERGLAVSIAYILVFAMITASLHECGHIVLGGLSKRASGSLKWSPRSAVATTNLSHVWAWSPIGRYSAILAGIGVDLAVLLIVAALRQWRPCAELDLMTSVLFLRIMWQFRLHSNCDGKYLARMILDDPLADFRITVSRRSGLKSRKSTPGESCFTALGYLSSALIFVIWIIPLIRHFSST